MSARKSIGVSRAYQYESDACVQALTSLLKMPVNKAHEPAPEPVGRDDTKESKNDGAANKQYT